MRHLLLRLLTGSAIVATSIAASAGAAPGAAPPSLVCTGSPFKLFDSWNGAGVLNGARSPVFNTLGRTYCVTSMTTYHWNNGQGQAPGTLGLGVVRGLGGAGKTLGPWPAAGSAGQGGAQNVNWSAAPRPGAPVLINGIYACRDSSRATWSQNPVSRGSGFCAVYVKYALRPGSPAPAPAPAPQPAPAPAPAQALCTPTPPSTYLIYPNHVAPGGTTRLLLWCNKPASLGFRGAFAPLGAPGVVIYDEQSFRNMHYVNGFLVPTSPSLPVRPPIVPVYRVLGDQASEVDLPASMARTTFVFVITYAHGQVASQNLLDTR